MDQEDTRAAARDALDLHSLGDSDAEDEEERRQRGAAMDLPEAPLMEWDLLKTQSLDFSDLLARRGREEPRYLRTSGEGLYPYTAPEPFLPPAPSAPPLPDPLPLGGGGRTYAGPPRMGTYPPYPRAPASPPRRLDTGLQFDLPGEAPPRPGTTLNPPGRLDEGLDISAISDARERLERFRRMREAVDQREGGDPAVIDPAANSDPAGRLRDYRQVSGSRKVKRGHCFTPSPVS